VVNLVPVAQKPIISTMERNRSKKAKAFGASGRKPVNNNKLPMQPPPFKAVPVRNGCVRMLATAAVDGDFTNLDLFNLPGCSVQTAISGIPISQAVRLRNIKIWSPVQTAGSTTTVTLIDNSGVAGTALDGMPEVFSDSSMSFDRPARLSWKTKKERPSGGWWAIASTSISRVLFNLKCPLGSIVDFHFEFILNLTINTGLAPAVVIVGATPGDLFNRLAITNLTPQSVLVL
jgi:hypothetical protein